MAGPDEDYREETDEKDAVGTGSDLEGTETDEDH